MLSISESLPEEQRVELRNAFDKLVSPEIITSVNLVLLEARNNPVNMENWPTLFSDAVQQEEFSPISAEAMEMALQIE